MPPRARSRESTAPGKPREKSGSEKGGGAIAPAPKPRQADAFPPTQRTWLGARLRGGGEGLVQANRHVMDIYAHPLKVYFLGSSFRGLGEPEDVVNGFFADRLSTDGYLERWLNSGRALRFWLIVGFKHYLLEEVRRQKRHRRERQFAEDPRAADAQMSTDHATSASGGPGTSSSDPERMFHHESALSIVRLALQQAEASCQRDGLLDHWRIFIRHHLDQRDYSLVSAEFGVEPSRASVMARTAANRFKNALRELVAWDGASSHDIDDELAQLLEVAGS